MGPEVTKVKKGDGGVLPFNISCGHCYFCEHDMESQCDNSNPNEAVDTGGYFRFTERYGNYPGGQAEYLRVPYGNFMPFVIPESCIQVLLLSKLHTIRYAFLFFPLLNCYRIGRILSTVMTRGLET